LGNLEIENRREWEVRIWFFHPLPSFASIDWRDYPVAVAKSLQNLDSLVEAERPHPRL